MDSYFKIQNLAGARQFDKFLKEYYQSNSPFQFQSYLNLSEWFAWSQKNVENGGRIFTSVFDIKLNYIFLDFEKSGLTKLWGERNIDNNILNKKQDFNLSVELLKYLSSYVLKYRALLDKLMGLIFLCYSPDEYDKYRRGKSRKTLFKNTFEKKSIPLRLDPERIFMYLDQFDSLYRTPEAHATGSMRKWVFSDINTGLYNYYKLSIESWNSLVYFISEIDKIKDNDKT
ncbi:MAG: hypothetical protein ACQETL_20120 [Bacteroidota bacterium]